MSQIDATLQTLYSSRVYITADAARQSAAIPQLQIETKKKKNRLKSCVSEPLRIFSVNKR